MIKSTFLLTMALSMSFTGPVWSQGPSDNSKTQKEGKILRLIWEGIPEAIQYEIQIAQDRRYKKIIIQLLQKESSGFIVIPLHHLKKRAFGRIRGILPDKTDTGWFSIRNTKWPPPKLKKRIRVPRGDADDFIIKWDPPVGEEYSHVIYRVRITPYRKRQILFDSIVRKTEITLPPLPGGNFRLSVEPIGDPISGTLHVDGTGIATALIETDALDYDPKEEARRKLSPDLLILMDRFKRGFVLNSELNYRGNEFHRAFGVEETIQITLDGGLQFAALLPMVLIESGTISFPPPAAPRLGGGPNIELSTGFEILRSLDNFLGARLTATLETATSDNSNETPFQITGHFIGRIIKGALSFDGTLFIGRAFSKSFDRTEGGQTTSFNARSYSVMGLTLNPAFGISKNFRIGATFGWTIWGEKLAFTASSGLTVIRSNTHTGKIVPMAYYQLATWLYVQGGIELTLGPQETGPESPLKFITGASVSF